MSDHDQDLLEAFGMSSDNPSPCPEGSRRRRSDRRAERENRKRRRRKRALVTTLVLVVVVAGVVFVGRKAVTEIQAASSASTAVADYPGPGETEVQVTIPEGATGAQIGEILQQEGVVATVSAFVTAFSANANSGNIQPGTYTLKTKMSAAEAVAGLLDPVSKTGHTFTIPEGFTKAQVRERLKTVGHFSDADIDAAYADPEAIGLPEAANGDVEGWLAASTYDFTEDVSATDIVAKMVAITLKRLDDAGVDLSDYQAVLTKASIIQREANEHKYYPQVARVIENRLNDQVGATAGLLQMDSTVLYGLGRFGGIPSQSDIEDSSNPYNTYVHTGLPPTPIGSPSEEAVAAVQNPAEGGWLYFVTVDLETGETLFASTLAEHEANVKRLAEFCKSHEDICSGSGGTPGTGQ